jgi:putative toxin-antitoxin system antitoxin component (TIGR02293 family)
LLGIFPQGGRKGDVLQIGLAYTAILLYIYSKYAVMGVKKEKGTGGGKSFDPKVSIKRANYAKAESHTWRIVVNEDEYAWTTKMERVAVIRKGLPYEAIEVLSQRANMSIRQVLDFLGVAQTTYNKKKRDKDLLSERDSEIVLVLTELLDFGLGVFNEEEEKFQRWLKKKNISLGGVAPESLFDTITGIQEVRNSLNRIEYGNMA